MRLDPLSGLHFSEKPGGFLGRLVLCAITQRDKASSSRFLHSRLASTLCPWVQMLSFSIDVSQETLIILCYSDLSGDVRTPSTAFYTVPFSEYQHLLGLQAWGKSSWLTCNPQCLKHSFGHLGGAADWYSESTRRWSFAFLIQIKFSVEAPTAGLI